MTRVDNQGHVFQLVIQKVHSLLTFEVPLPVVLAEAWMQVDKEDSSSCFEGTHRGVGARS